MFSKLSTLLINSYLVILLSFVSVVGDYFVFTLNKPHTTRAIIDNLTHSAIGAISWVIVVLNCKDVSNSVVVSVQQTLLCALIASLIDLDHFLSARSFSLKAATNLKKRPILHCTTVPLLLTVFLFLMSHSQKSEKMKIAALILCIAFLSHHTRDATRRGYWLHPFGSTPPIPYMMYISITCLLPYIVCAYLKNSYNDEHVPLQKIIIA